MAARPRFTAAIWTPLLLSPFIGELLRGSTRASIFFVYVPEIMVWGVGALFCRELVRRWRMADPCLTIGSWPKIDTLGKMVFDALALTGFLLLAKNVWARAKSDEDEVSN